MRAELIPPLMAYHVVGKRGSAPATPWYLAGGVSAANCIAAYQPKGAADLAASYVNLANPGTYNCTVVAEPGWDATNGWQGDNTDNHLNTEVACNTIVSVIVRFSNSLTNTRNDMCGQLNASTKYYMLGNWSSGFRFYKGDANYYQMAVTAAGVACISAYKTYMDGTFKDSITSGGTLPTETFRILHSTADPFSGYIQALALYDAELNATQVATISTAMAAL